MNKQIFCPECGDGSTKSVTNLTTQAWVWSSYIIHKPTCSKYLPPPSDGMAEERSARRIRKTQYLVRER